MQLVEFKQFSEVLKERHNVFEEQWNLKQAKIEKLVEEINLKKQLLKDINHKNIALGSQYTKTLKILEYVEA